MRPLHEVDTKLRICLYKNWPVFRKSDVPTEKYKPEMAMCSSGKCNALIPIWQGDAADSRLGIGMSVV